MTYFLRCLVVILIMTSAPAWAVMASKPVVSEQSTAQLVADRAHITQSQPFWVALHLELRDGWHSYWQNAGDSGLPTELTLFLPEGFTAQPMQWQTPIRFESSGIISYGYEHDAWHFVRITPPAILNVTEIPLKAKATWLVCKEICIPESAEFSLSLPVGAALAPSDATFHAELIKVPQSSEVKAHFNGTEKHLSVLIKDTTLGNELRFFPMQNGIVSNDVLPIVSRTQDGVMLTFEKGTETAEETLHAVVQDIINEKAMLIVAVFDGSLTVGSLPPSPATATPLTTTLALLFAFGGGLILNLMPCVLPVLSLKALSLSRIAEHSRRAAAAHGIAYTAGVLICFAIFAVILITLKAGGAEIGWGFQLQSPAFVAALSLLMLLVGLNLSGVYELPMLLGNAGQSLAAKPTPIGSFATGMLAVLVATPCTAPLMAPALGYALTQSPTVSLAIFLALGVGLATPFLLISVYPTFIKKLPKAGAWTQRFKQFLAFPMYGTAAWLAWVLTRQSGADALAILLAVATFSALLVWSAAIAQTRGKRIVMAILLLLLCGGAISTIDLMDAEIASLEQQSEVFTQAKLDILLRDGKPVFVYATADWCITCKINERIALNTQAVSEHFSLKGITMLKADWTHRDAAITAFLTEHNRAGVPVYVYYDKEGKPTLLPQLLTPSTVIEATK
jgi:thiol:disulfide interchange protein